MKIGRNDPCPCGSGKKFKKCCIDKPEYNTVAVATAPKSGGHSHDHHGHDHDDHDHDHHSHGHDHRDHVHDPHDPHSHDHDDQHAHHDDNNKHGLHLVQDGAADGLAVSGLRHGGQVSAEYEPLARSMEQGFAALQKGAEEQAARIWLEGFSFILELRQKWGLSSLESLDDKIAGDAPELVMNFVQDLEECIGNLAIHDDAWSKERLTMIEQFLDAFPDTDPSIIFNMREAAAETMFLLQQPDKGDNLFADLVRDYPDNAWAYIGWGDMYSPAFYRDAWPKNPVRAREIYERGLAGNVVEDKSEIEQRIGLLESE